MQELKKLQEAIKGGGSVMLGGTVYTDADALKEAYPAAKEAYDSAQPARGVAPAHDTKAVDALKKRNTEQADLIDLLTKDPSKVHADYKDAVAAFRKGK